MKSTFTVLISTAMLLSASATFAQSGNKTDTPQDPMVSKDKPMTTQQCKDHMEMSKKAGTATSPTDDMRKIDAMCAEMMKKADMSKKEPAKY